VAVRSESISRPDADATPVKFPADDTAGGLGYILLLSERLPGLGYYAEVRADVEGRVYLGERVPDDIWAPVGQSFSSWVRQ
jgi:hypothetical protein